MRDNVLFFLGIREAPVLHILGDSSTYFHAAVFPSARNDRCKLKHERAEKETFAILLRYRGEGQDKSRDKAFDSLVNQLSLLITPSRRVPIGTMRVPP